MRKSNTRAQTDMANNPRKVKDPTEVALSAIQEALNIADVPPSQIERMSRIDQPELHGEPERADIDDRPMPSFERSMPSLDDIKPADRVGNERIAPTRQDEQATFTRRAANDDRETIGQLLQAIQKGRAGRNAYVIATIFAGLWFAALGILTFAFLPSLQQITSQGGGGVLAIAGLAALVFVPMLLFYFLASLAW